MLCKYGKETRDFWGVLFLVSSNFVYFWAVFNKTIIPFAFVGYEIGYLPAISYPTRAHGITVNYTPLTLTLVSFCLFRLLF